MTRTPGAPAPQRASLSPDLPVSATGSAPDAVAVAVAAAHGGS